ncbi:MAG: hypothetical protein BRC33_07865 [Cyanobacteria bacterium SW_9_44_58]|nr:MAG: hypothetical protein BRC33_07865 [Cyanobacteria bacterium SW_9_44_58]
MQCKDSGIGIPSPCLLVALSPYYPQKSVANPFDLKLSSFKLWRKRVTGRKTKHEKKSAIASIPPAIIDVYSKIIVFLPLTKTRFSV